MSNAVFPTMPGLSWNVVRRPRWSTVVKQSVSGREFRAAQFSYPIWEYELSYEVLRGSSALPEVQQLIAFFNARSGSYDTFLYTDPDDKSATAQQFGTGDGTTKSFQLVRAFGGYTEPVYDVKGTPSIYVAGSLKATPADYSISSTGLVTFVNAPTSGQILTWTGNFYWRCRFMQDEAEFTQFLWQLWELKRLTFRTVKP